MGPLGVVSILYGVYILFKLYVSTMQAGFVAKAKRGEALLLLPGQFLKAGRYALQKERLTMVETLIEYLLFLFWMGAGLAWLDRLIDVEDPLVKSVLFVDAFLAINYLVMLPLQFYRKFVLDQAFGFNRSTIKLFLLDQLKIAILFLLFGSLVIYGISWVILSLPNWWLWGALFLFGVIVAINLLYPTLIAPLFHNFTTLENEELRGQIEELLRRSGFRSDGVFVIDSSRRDSRLNAYFAGLGRSKRVVLFDTLVQKLSSQELLAVLGHELGHFRHKDVIKHLLLIGLILFLLFALFAHLPDELYQAVGLEPGVPHGTIVFFLLLSPPLFFFLMPLVNLVSRSNEFAADRYAGRLVGRAPLRSALLKLVQENSHFPLAHPLYVFFYYSHPPIIDRLQALGFQEQGNIQEAMREELESDAHR
ncbi:MAG: peptidase M48 [Nitratiruptor sp.]|nr:peptidase M48 [Nitratiruptor sp.]NPA83276.1 M48 family metallopeptidase [Campylobacterota bacterium]